MNTRIVISLSLVLGFVPLAAFSEQTASPDAVLKWDAAGNKIVPAGAQAEVKEKGWLDRSTELAAADPAKSDSASGAAAPAAEKAAPPAEKGPPLPFHTIEGYGGGAITPIAYLVNPPKKGDWFGLPAAAFSNVILGKKNLQAFTVSENILGRVELSYGLDRFGLGSLPRDIKNATGVDIRKDEVWLHNFNLRGLLLEENSFGTSWLPAITGGVHFKVNDGVGAINNRLGGALAKNGYDTSWGVDYTLTASKAIKGAWTFDRPLIVSAGLRNSEASNLGFLGFGGDRHTTVEGNVVYLPTDWLLVAYEYRQKANQYTPINNLTGREDDWHGFDVSWLINKNATLTAGWGIFGNVLNTEENGVWWLQFKYEL